MGDLLPKKSKLKWYPHFDQFLPIKEIQQIVTNPERVRKNAFYPFICYEKRWKPFESAKPKVRKIRYASRRDAYIFAHYRGIISEYYELELKKLEIEDCPIAYRKIPAAPGVNKGKCNIDFAKDAFDRITDLGNCCAVVLDISSYFECIDHSRLKEIWCRLLGVQELSSDHAAIFKAITKYAVVDRQKVYERLGFFGSKKNKGGHEKKGFLVPFKDMPMQLCSPKDFRDKICGDSSKSESLVEINNNPYGIPQGAPISDLLANIFLIDFDVLISQYAKQRGGYYFRYSDDILLVIPGDDASGVEARDFVIDQIKKFGAQLKIKAEKTSVVKYFKTEELQDFEFIGGAQGENGLEYLGFRFDGQRVYLRDSTLSNLYRKITFKAKREADMFVRRYPGKDIKWLVENFNYEHFTKSFGRVEDFEDKAEYKDWTFWTYASRAAETFGKPGLPILRQVRHHRKIVRRIIEKELTSFYLRRRKKLLVA